jgi:hypothetical protein
MGAFLFLQYKNNKCTFCCITKAKAFISLNKKTPNPATTAITFNLRAKKQQKNRKQTSHQGALSIGIKCFF